MTCTEPDYFIDDESSACDQKCPLNQRRNTGDGKGCDCTRAGFYEDGAKACHKCPTGHFCEGGGAKEACPARTHNNNTESTAASACAFCPAGTFTDSEGQAVCTPCPVGHYCPGGSAGMEAHKGGKVPCPRGYYQDETGWSQCVQCPISMYQDQEGQTGCTRCDGEVGILDRTYCQPCEVGTFFNWTSDVCHDCPTSGGEGHRLLTACDPLIYNGRSNFTECASNCTQQNHYLHGPKCPGNGSLETRTCRPCSGNCTTDHYTVQQCDSSQGKDTLCAVCNKSQCNDTQYVTNRCQGPGLDDLSKCQNCTLDCGLGRYLLPPASCGAPGGLTDNACADCPVCPTGTYISGDCDGVANRRTCEPCRTTCGDGEALGPECDGGGQE